MMKILFIGLGSIGQRHVRNIRHLYGDSVELIAYRSRGLNRTITESMEVDEGVSPEKRYGIRPFRSLDEALKENPDIAFITNVTSAHISCALRAVDAGCDIFIEKPLSDSVEGIAALKKATTEKKRIVFVGFQNRFHPGLCALKQSLRNGIIGVPLLADVYMGERVSTMHSYEDYRGTYMVDKEQGGGVVLSQQIHELDYMYYLFGKPKRVYAIAGTSGCLDSDVEEFISAIYTHELDGREFPVYARADFFQYPPTRSCKIVGTDGTLELDLVKMTSTVRDSGGFEKAIVFNSVERNSLFLAELESFMQSVQLRKAAEVGLDEAMVSMQMALAAKRSADQGKAIEINEIVW